jgi:hypothetical protein
MINPFLAQGKDKREWTGEFFFWVVGAEEVRAWNTSVLKIAIIGPKLKCTRCRNHSKRKRRGCSAILSQQQNRRVAPRYKKSISDKGHSDGQGDWLVCGRVLKGMGNDLRSRVLKCLPRNQEADKG